MAKILNRDCFRIGWELEYQSTAMNEQESFFDEEAYDEACNARAYEMRSDSLTTIARYYNRLHNLIMQRISDVLCDTRKDTMDVMRNNYDMNNGCDRYELFTKLNTNLTGNRLSQDDLYNAFVEANLNVEEVYELVTGGNYEGDYLCYLDEDTEEAARRLIDKDDYTHDEETTLDLPYNLVRVYDGSVSGGEIKVDYIRGCSIDTAKALITKLGDKYDFINDLDVDDECSFHVHISNSEINHSYGANIQAFMYEYLFEHMEALPKNVLKRLDYDTDRWRDEYFSLVVDSGKYKAIAFRDGHGTWEFRFMGNISNAQEGVACIDFAVRCYSWAYEQAVLLGNECEFDDVDTQITSKVHNILKQKEVVNG